MPDLWTIENRIYRYKKEQTGEDRYKLLKISHSSAFVLILI